MAVPDTTTFTLQDVADEFGLGSNDGLTDCFDEATSSDFDVLYEGNKDELLNFRNYGGVTLIAVTMSSGTSKDVCNETPNITRYTDGTDSSGPVVGDVVYTNSTGTSFLASGNYKSQMGSSGSNVQIGSNGVVTARNSC